MPDVALIGPAQRASMRPEARVQEFCPLLMAQIVSPSHTVDELARKTRQYLEGGARTVWILIPLTREIQVYSADAHPRILCAEDTLDEPALLPGFTARVGDLFEV